MEQWKDIQGYEGLYKISSYGRILSHRKSKGKSKYYKYTRKEIIMTPRVTDYCRIKLNHHKDPKSFFIHRLVAIHFIPNPNNKRAVNHKDGNKHNNHVDNLEWVTDKENTAHAILTGLFIVKKAKTA